MAALLRGDTQQFGCNIHAHNPQYVGAEFWSACRTKRIGTEVAGFAYPFYPASSAGCLQTSQLIARCGWQSGLQQAHRRPQRGGSIHRKSVHKHVAEDCKERAGDPRDHNATAMKVMSGIKTTITYR